MKHIAFIGAGNMGGALVRGACKALDPQEVLIYEPSQKAAAALSAETGCQVAASGAQAVREARYVMLCVKPQVLEPVLEGLLPALREGAQAGEHRVVVSIAAGVQLEALDQMLARGGLEVPVLDILPSPEVDRYRNKVQLPVGTDENGHIVTGFFAGRSHRIVACTDCKLQPAWMNELAARACALLEENGITAYNEETHTGRVRHLYMRQGWHSGQRLLCFVVNGNGLPNEAEICATLQKEFALTTILVNRNSERTNVILGRRTRTVLGPGVIEDTLAGVPLRMGVHEFYQVNTPAAEVLYAKAREYAGLKPDDFLLDLYCGMGTIGLSMLADCKRLVGVEVVPQAVEGAKETAARLGLDADRADFRCQDAGAAAAQLAAEGARPDVIVVDPPRKGCDEATLTAIAEMAPRTVVMVSCNAATAARDAKWLTEHGYKAVEVQPVDLFPRTKHVETVVLLSHKKADSYIHIDVEFGEGEGKIPVDSIAKRAEAYKPKEKVTYKMIKEYIEAKYGFKVHTAYIAEVKRNLGLPMYDAPNAVEELKQPRKHPTPEKVEAIKDALRYFAVI